MANLDRLFRWEPFIPDLGGNRELERPFYFELAVGLTKEQLRQVYDGLGDLRRDEHPDETPEQLVERTVAGIDAALKPYVRLGKEPLSIDGKPITTLLEYLTVCATVSDMLNLYELPRALTEANSTEGARELFFARLSGGFTSMAFPKIEKAGSQRAAP